MNKNTKDNIINEEELEKVVGGGGRKGKKRYDSLESLERSMLFPKLKSELARIKAYNNRYKAVKLLLSCIDELDPTAEVYNSVLNEFIEKYWDQV